MQGQVPALRGADLFVEQLELIERVIAFVCVRQSVSATDADEFGAYVRLKLVDNDYAVLAKFEGRSSLRTYLTVVIQRLFLDFRIHEWGKWRPSAAANRLGPTAVLLEQLLTKDGYSFEEACEILKLKHRVSATRAELERLGGLLPPRVPNRLESDEVLAEVASPGRSPDDVLDAAQTASALQAVLKGLAPQDRLILAMRFEDGRSVADIAGVLGVDQYGMNRRIDRLLKEMRKALELAGIDSTAAWNTLEGPVGSVDWRSDTNAKRSTSRPSIPEEATGWR